MGTLITTMVSDVRLCAVSERRALFRLQLRDRHPNPTRPPVPCANSVCRRQAEAGFSWRSMSSRSSARSTTSSSTCAMASKVVLVAAPCPLTAGVADDCGGGSVALTVEDGAGTRLGRQIEAAQQLRVERYDDRRQ